RRVAGEAGLLLRRPRRRAVEAQEVLADAGHRRAHGLLDLTLLPRELARAAVAEVAAVESDLEAAAVQPAEDFGHGHPLGAERDAVAPPIGGVVAVAARGLRREHVERRAESAPLFFADPALE